MTSMYVGGAETSLLGLMDSIDYAEYDVDLMLFRHDGEFMPLINNKVNLLAPVWQYENFDVPIKSLKGKRLPFAAARLLSKLAVKRCCRRQKNYNTMWKSVQYIYKFCNPLLPKIKGEYDIAISFMAVPFYFSKINAKKKLAWIHTDYRRLDADRKLDAEWFKLTDKVVTVSEECEKAFLEVYPDMKEKSLVVENCLSERIVSMRSKEFNAEAEMPSDGCVKILSVGRFSYAKNFDNVPKICKLLLADGFNIKWYLIGDGSDYIKVKKIISEENIAENVILLGKKSNTYPYILACDIYAQPSRFEGKCVSVREAQMLSKPVIIAEYKTAPSQLESGVDGIIAPQTNEGFAEALENLISDKALREKIIVAESKRDYTNSSETEKIYKTAEN